MGVELRTTHKPLRTLQYAEKPGLGGKGGACVKGIARGPESPWREAADD
jgi:hypothetical protein